MAAVAGAAAAWRDGLVTGRSAAGNGKKVTAASSTLEPIININM